MGLFDKKYCDICNDKIGLLGNRKLEDGNMCKKCAALLSPFMTDRRKTNLEEIKEHLEYREENKTQVSAFNVTRTLGDKTKVLLDEDNKKFIVTSSGRWQNENPDVIAYSQVTGCQTDIQEIKNELKTKDKEGKMISYNPPRYEFKYNFNIAVYINSKWFSEIKFQLNSSSVNGRGSVDYREFEHQANEIKEALTQVRQETRDNITAGNAPKIAQVCKYCGATTTPDKNGCCEFCGGALQG